MNTMRNFIAFIIYFSQTSLKIYIFLKDSFDHVYIKKIPQSILISKAFVSVGGKHQIFKCHFKGFS